MAAKIHLWIGLLLAVYLFVLSVTGSLVVLRPQFHRWLTQPQIEVGAPLAGEALEGALRRAYPDFIVESIRSPRSPKQPSIVVLAHDGVLSERLFDPYRGVDLGSAYPAILGVVEWLVRLHDNLLAGHTGRIINGAGGGLLAMLALSGLLVWATGRSRWRNVISTGRPALSTVFARRLHVAMGFWLCGLMLVWAVTAIYFAFPELFGRLFDLLDPNLDDDVRPGESVLDALIKLHFGRMGGMLGRTAWIVLGLLPAVLAVTGVIIWLRKQRDSTSESSR